MDIALFYFLLLGFAILMYVLLDGFDLGIGILYPWFNSDAEHDHLMRSVAHVWDGNETWLVFGGVILFGAFPSAYALILSSLYLPIMLMLIGLIFRGVAFEYRFKSDSSKKWWSRAFSLGSTLAAFCQGLMLGSLVQGVPEGIISQSSLALLTPFTVFTGLAVVAGYALLACAYLVMKSRGAIQHKAAQRGRLLVWLVMLAGAQKPSSGAASAGKTRRSAFLAGRQPVCAGVHRPGCQPVSCFITRSAELSASGRTGSQFMVYVAGGTDFCAADRRIHFVGLPHFCR